MLVNIITYLSPLQRLNSELRQVPLGVHSNSLFSGEHPELSHQKVRWAGTLEGGVLANGSGDVPREALINGRWDRQSAAWEGGHPPSEVGISTFSQPPMMSETQRHRSAVHMQVDMATCVVKLIQPSIVPARSAFNFQCFRTVQ